MLELETEFNDYAGCYKYELLGKKMIEFFAGTLAPLHISEYPEFIQGIILDKAQELAEQRMDEIKNTDLHLLDNLAKNAWLDEVEKLEKLALN